MKSMVTHIILDVILIGAAINLVIVGVDSIHPIKKPAAEINLIAEKREVILNCTQKKYLRTLSKKFFSVDTARDRDNIIRKIQDRHEIGYLAVEYFPKFPEDQRKSVTFQFVLADGSSKKGVKCSSLFNAWVVTKKELSDAERNAAERLCEEKAKEILSDKNIFR